MFKLFIIKNSLPKHERAYVKNCMLIKSLVAEYNIALQSRFSCFEPEQDLEALWSEFKNSIHEVSMDVLGQKPKRRREEHLSSDTKNLLLQRSAVKRCDPTSDANKSKYSRLNKMVKKSCKTYDKNWALRVPADLVAAVRQKIKYLSNKRIRK